MRLHRVLTCLPILLLLLAGAARAEVGLGVGARGGQDFEFDDPFFGGDLQLYFAQAELALDVNWEWHTVDGGEDFRTTNINLKWLASQDRFLQPFLGGGLAIQAPDVIWDGDTSVGLNMISGLEAKISRVKLFYESRYTFRDDLADGFGLIGGFRVNLL